VAAVVADRGLQSVRSRWKRSTHVIWDSPRVGPRLLPLDVSVGLSGEAMVSAITSQIGTSMSARGLVSSLIPATRSAARSRHLSGISGSMNIVAVVAMVVERTKHVQGGW
jgi:hypothetical protein